MKTRCMISLLSWAVTTLTAGELAGNWWTVEGGGGASTSTVHTLTGTIGQPDTGAMSAGDYTLGGGFWRGVIPQRPKLNIELLPDGSVRVSWPTWASNYVLKFAGELTVPMKDWETVPPATYQADGTCWIYILEPDPTGDRFYALAKPGPDS